MKQKENKLKLNKDTILQLSNDKKDLSEKEMQKINGGARVSKNPDTDNCCDFITRYC